MAEAWSFVSQLPEKWDTQVGLGGNLLSGGQKQRVAIARALLKKPRVMLFDEATSALDRRNERLIQNTLDSIARGLTSITVAHRIKTIMGSDIIYVLDRGGIKESGPFNRLSRFNQYQQMIKDEQKEEQKEIESQNEEKL